MSDGKKVYVQILHHLETLIMQDKLQAGDKLPSERELAEKLGVGRSSVREAFRALELLDLIETRKGEGTFLRLSGSHRLAEILAGFFLKDARAHQDLAETRAILEVEAARLASERAGEEEKRHLYQLAEYAHQQDVEKALEADIHFHRTLVSLGGNKLILNIWIPLVEYSRTALRQSLSREGRIEDAYQEHLLIVDSILKGPDEAAGAVRLHMKNSRF
ncbi:FadR/GntR family transcriptional regulator [Alkalicoccus urumqiensis]|uniref:Transcriptional regulator n=1 Tax=Alkalicoccus urumqiensis TaxID=1548213 RepID=A0A2P6MDH3_ALKUR|nr:GntR family transcriptional regulator [Alkalicoccus urumqiensis]PRO64326.1 transcriptional regulator [Alkalicoccus urumqiensis]